MKDKTKLDLYYGLICPFCKTFRKMLKKIVAENPDKFDLKEILVSSPIGMIKSFRLGVHSVPTLVVNNKVVFRELPKEIELKRKLNLK